MKDFKPLGTLIHGIAASEHLDSSGERISIRGLDISSLPVDGVFNWEHKNDNSFQIVGKILKAKKIFSEKDCEDEHELYFWNKAQAPYVYVMGELFDGVGHKAAAEVAAMLRYDSAARKAGRTGKNVINFSIEGSKLNKEGQEIQRSLGRKVTITTAACNKVAVAEELRLGEEPSDNLDFAKSESGVEIMRKDAKILKLPKLGALSQKPVSASGSQKLPWWASSKADVDKYKQQLKQIDVQDRQKRSGLSSASLKPNPPKPSTDSFGPTSLKPNKLFDPDMSGTIDYKSVKKTLTAGSGLSAPSTKTGGEALASESIEKDIKKLPSFEKFLKFIQNKYPNMSKDESEAMAKYFTARSMIRAEEALEKIANEDLDKSKNVREQRKKIFGTDANAPRHSEKRMKMMQQIRDFVQRRFGMPMVTAEGKRDSSGKIREDKDNQPAYDVFTPEGIAKEKELLEQYKKKGIKRVDPKPDWRSGRLETQPSPDAAVHEVAHLYLSPEDMTPAMFQEYMDKLWGESQSKYGHMQQKKTSGEIQPMAVENPIRRELGLPANRATKPVKQNERALDYEGDRFVEGKDSKGRKVFYDRQSRLMTPETRERVEQVREGSLKFHPEIGWFRDSSPDALINLRGRGKTEEAKIRAEQRYKPAASQKMAASEKIKSDLNKIIIASIPKKKPKTKAILHDHGTDYSVHHDPNYDHFGHPIKRITDIKKNSVENFEPLQKGKKDILQMMGPEPEQHHHEFANWASKALPNQNWQTWAARHYKNKPEDFTPEVKQELEHFGGSTHIPEVAKVRFDKQHDLHTGMKMFQDAYDQYNNRIKENKNLVRPTESTQKIVEGVKPNRHWFGLGVGACRNEGKAMGHCGNVPSEVEGDKLLSLRTEHKVGDKVYHEPHLTFVVNNGFLGEMKGRGNTKPSKEYYRDIANLLKNPNIKGVIGGGYAPENNFKFSDLSPELQREVKQANPDLITSLEGSDNIEKIISKKDILPEKHRDIIINVIQNPDLDPKHHEKFVNDKNQEIRHAIAKNPNLDPKHHEKLLNDEDSNVRYAIIKNPNLDPKHHEKLVNHEDWNIRQAIALNPNLDPKHHEKLVNDNEARVRRAIALNPNLDPKHQEKLVNDEDWVVRKTMAKNPNLDPKHQEKLVNDEESVVRHGIALNPNLDPKHQEKLVNDESWSIRQTMAENPNLDPKFYEKLANDKDLYVRQALERNPSYIKYKEEQSKKMAASEKIQNSLKKSIIISIFDPFENLEKSEAPRYEGHIDEERGRIGKMYPNGILMWHHMPHIAHKNDQIINNPNLINSFLSKLPQSHRYLASKVISHVASDPNRHFIPTEEGGRNKLRARHIKDLLLGDKDITIDTSEPNVLRIKRSSHSQGQNFGREINFEFRIKGAKNVGGVGKTEKDVGRRIAKNMQDVQSWTGFVGSLLAKRNGLYLGKSWQAASAKANREGGSLDLNLEKGKDKKPLNKPIRTPGENKKFKVYVKDGDKIKTVRFGDPNMEIKRDSKERRSNFRARHNCDNPGPKTKPRFWSCKMWSKKNVSDLTKSKAIVNNIDIYNNKNDNHESYINKSTTKTSLQKMSRPRITFPNFPKVTTRPDQEVQPIETNRQRDIFSRKAIIPHFQAMPPVDFGLDPDRPEYPQRLKERKEVRNIYKEGEIERVSEALDRKHLGINIDTPRGPKSAGLTGKRLAGKIGLDTDYQQKLKEHNEKRNQIIRDYNQRYKDWVNTYNERSKGLPTGSPELRQLQDEMAALKPQKPKLPRAPAKRKDSIDMRSLSPENYAMYGRIKDSVLEHEGFHHAMDQLSHKYGKNVARKVLDKIIDAHDKDALRAVGKFISENYSYKPTSDHFDEEVIAHARDLLVNPRKRKIFEEHYGDKAKEYISKLKAGHERAVKVARTLKPEDFEDKERLASSEEMKNGVARGKNE